MHVFAYTHTFIPVSYTHLTLPTMTVCCSKAFRRRNSKTQVNAKKSAEEL